MRSLLGFTLIALATWAFPGHAYAQFGGYQVVTRQMPVPAGSPRAQVTATCPTGKVAISGGFLFTPPGRYGLDQSEPRADGNGWQVTVNRMDGVAGRVTTYAVCVNADQLPSKTAVLTPPSGVVTMEVPCGPGKVAVNGGLIDAVGSQIYELASRPVTNGSGWVMSVYHTSTNRRREVEAYAICVPRESTTPPDPNTPANSRTATLYDALDSSQMGFTPSGGVDLTALENQGSTGKITLSKSTAGEVSVVVDVTSVVSGTYNVFLHQASASEVLQTSNIGQVQALTGTGSGGAFSAQAVLGAGYFWISLVQVGGQERYRSTSVQF